MDCASDHRPSPWMTWLFYAIVGALAVIRIWDSCYDDFAVYWRAGKEAIQGLSLYQETGHWQFKYAPFTALSLGWIHQILLKLVGLLGIANEGFRPHGAPGGLLVSEGSRWVANLFYWIFLASWTSWLVSLARSLSPAPLRSRHLALVLILLTQSLSQELNLGQVNFIPILFIAFALRQLDRPDDSWLRAMACGSALGLAIQFKLFSLIVFPLLAFRGRWGWILASIFSIAACNLLIPGLLHGWPHALNELRAWAVTLTHSSDQLLYSGHNISWIGTIGKASGIPAVAKFSWMAMVGAFLLLQFRMRHRDADTQIAWNLAAILVLNPLVWNYWMLFLAPLLFQLLNGSDNWLKEGSRQAIVAFLLIAPGFVVIFSAWSRNWVEPATILMLLCLWLCRILNSTSPAHGPS